MGVARNRLVKDECLAVIVVVIIKQIQHLEMDVCPCV